MSHFG